MQKIILINNNISFSGLIIKKVVRLLSQFVNIEVNKNVTTICLIVYKGPA